MDHLLERHSFVGARMDRLYRVVFSSTYRADLNDLGYGRVAALLKKVEQCRNWFAHGHPEAIDDALVEELVAGLKDEHEAWIAVFNKRLRESREPPASVARPIGRGRREVPAIWQAGTFVGHRNAVNSMHHVSFTDAYKAWRNRARKFNPESIVRGAIDVLGERSSDPVEELKKAPWLAMPMMKWTCEDRYPGRAQLPSISPEQLYELRQRL